MEELQPSSWKILGALENLKMKKYFSSNDVKAVTMYDLPLTEVSCSIWVEVVDTGSTACD